MLISVFRKRVIPGSEGSEEMSQYVPKVPRPPTWPWNVLSCFRSSLLPCTCPYTDPWDWHKLRNKGEWSNADSERDIPGFLVHLLTGFLCDVWRGQSLRETLGFKTSQAEKPDCKFKGSKPRKEEGASDVFRVGNLGVTIFLLRIGPSIKSVLNLINDNLITKT